jgi:flagellar biogenesis protein FliO
MSRLKEIKKSISIEKMKRPSLGFIVFVVLVIAIFAVTGYYIDKFMKEREKDGKKPDPPPPSKKPSPPPSTKSPSTTKPTSTKPTTDASTEEESVQFGAIIGAGAIILVLVAIVVYLIRNENAKNKQFDLLNEAKQKLQGVDLSNEYLRKLKGFTRRIDDENDLEEISKTEGKSIKAHLKSLKGILEQARREATSQDTEVDKKVVELEKKMERLGIR